MAARKTKRNPVELRKDIMSALVSEHVDTDIDKMPLKCWDDYKAYNRKARALNKKLKQVIYPVKPCPIELHPSETIIFGRNDQPSNPLPVYKSDENIEFSMTLIPGKTYTLPKYIINWLSEKGTPVWKWFVNSDGSKETRIDHKKPRFALRTKYSD